MRLSESLRKGIMEPKVGGVINRFKIRSRRSVLFFEDILANYIRICEENGKKHDTFMMAKKWTIIITQQLIPKYIKRLPYTLLTLTGKNVWRNLGLIDDINVKKEGNILDVKTKNESITRLIGKNNFMVGFYIGIFYSFLKSDIKVINVLQTRKSCHYRFRIVEGFSPLKAKDRNTYQKLNKFSEERGITLNDAFKKDIFQLKENNRIYFRGTSIIPIENTIFQIIGNENLFLDITSDISYKYFKGLLKHSRSNAKLKFLKNLLQITGWGIARFIIDENRICIEIRNPPYGLQAEKDNWKFLHRVILGYLQTIDKGIKIKSIKESYKQVNIIYSTR